MGVNEGGVNKGAAGVKCEMFPQQLASAGVSTRASGLIFQYGAV